MKRVILFFLFVCIPVLLFSQSKTSELGLNVTYSDKSYVIENKYLATDVNTEFYDYTLFNDWGFLDSLRNQLYEFYNRNLGYDTLNKYLGSVNLSVDTSGKLLYYSIFIPEDCESLFSLKTIKELNELILNFRFDFPDYKRPVRRFFYWIPRDMNVNSFEYFYIGYSMYPKNEIVSDWDSFLDWWRNPQMVGKWKIADGREIIFHGKPAHFQVKMPHPLTGEVHIYDCSLFGDILYVWFDNERIPLRHGLRGDRMTLSGNVDSHAFKWELTRDTTFVDEK